MSSQTLHFLHSQFISDFWENAFTQLEKIENVLNIRLVTRENWIQITGQPTAIERATFFFKILEKRHLQGVQIQREDFDYLLNQIATGSECDDCALLEEPLAIPLRSCRIIAKTLNQTHYLRSILSHDIVFGIGPAGTGKTYLAMAAALDAFLRDKVRKIIITRPAVEAGEALGYLPGELQDKILPYLRPLYDAMYQMLGQEDTKRIIAKGAIEIAPLAYMRGRTLSNAFILLDEAQNTTPEQMLMFLTRLGHGSQMVITGDITQVDLPASRQSGLKQALTALASVEKVKCFYFEPHDIVRHQLVQKVIAAFHQ